MSKKPNTPSCELCGSTRTVQTEGKLFCAVCQTQIEQFFEVDADDDRITFHYSVMLSTKKRREEVADGVDLEENEREMTTYEPQATTSSRNASGKERKRKNDEPHGSKIRRGDADQNFSDSYNLLLTDNRRHERHEHIGGVTARLGSFSKALMKISSMMMVELGFPETYPKQCLCVFQRYLSKCGAAFVKKEYTEDSDKMFRKAIFSMKSKEQLNDIRKKKDLARKKKGMSMMETTADVWNTVLDKNMTEHFEMDDDEEEEENPDVITRLSTTDLHIYDSNLDKDLMEIGLQCYLDTDVLVAILFIAAVSAGCQWVQLSDIVRWIREDRGRISGQLTFALAKTKHNLANLAMPLYEFERISLWVWQQVDVDTSRISIDFPQLISRALYNLNLPADLMDQVLFLFESAPPSQLLDAVYLTQQGDVAEGITCDRLRNTSFLPQVFGRHNKRHKNLNTDAFLTTETKILAYVLLALKLIYGLDDYREHKAPKGSFNPIEWMYQLRMRQMIWNGHNVKDVLSQSSPVFPMSYSHHIKDNDTLSLLEDRFTLNHLFRGGGFSTCMPTHAKRESSYETTNPLSDDVTHKVNRNDDDMVYAVIRAQAAVAKTYLTKGRSEEEKKKLMDKVYPEALRILSEEYSSCRIVGPKRSCKNSDVYGGPEATTDRCLSEADSERWKKFFPSSRQYIEYPRPLWAQGMVIYGREDDLRLKAMNAKTAPNDKKMCGPRAFFLSYGGVADLHTAASSSWSKCFSQLLDMFAKSISEHHYILYGAFCMLEQQILRRTEYQRTCSRLVNGDTVDLKFVVQKKIKDGKSRVSRGVADVSSMENIGEARELRWLRFGVPRDWGDVDLEQQRLLGLNKEVPLSDVESGSTSSDEEFAPLSDSSSESEPEVPVEELNKITLRKTVGKKLLGRFHSRFYEWDTFWRLLTMRYW